MAATIIKLFFSREAQPPSPGQGALDFAEQNIPRPLQNTAFAATSWLWKDTPFIMQMTLRLQAYKSLELFRESEVSLGILIV